MDKNKGPIEILCEEIGFQFDKRLESPEMLVSFVKELVSRIAEMREFQVAIREMTGKAPSVASSEVLRRVVEMLAGYDPESLIQEAAAIHDYIHQAAPDDAEPCDHLIDMLSSCVSAIRFGLETPCHSRHAAEAASHVWRQVYGVRLFDSFTSGWQKEWTRAQLQAAVIARIDSDSRARH